MLTALIRRSAASAAAARTSLGDAEFVAPEDDDPSTVCPPECVPDFEQREPISVRNGIKHALFDIKIGCVGT